MVSWYTLAQIVVQGVGFLSAVIVSRYLGPVNLGIYSFALTYTTSFMAIIAGIDFYCTWQLAKSTEKERDVWMFVGHKINLYSILTILALVVGYIALPKTIFIFIAILVLPLFLQSLSIFTLYAAATERARLLALTQISSSVFLFIIKFILVQNEASLYPFFAVAAADLIINGLILFVYFIKKPLWKEALSRQPMPRCKETFTFVWKIKTSLAALASWQLLLRGDQLFLAAITSASTLGLYSASTKIAEIPNFLAGVLSTALIQKITYATTTASYREGKKSLLKMVFLFFGIGLLIAITIIILAPFLVSFIYGDAFSESASILKVYALSIPALFLNYLFLGIFASKQNHSLQMKVFTAALILNAALIIFLTPLFGAEGTALGTVISYSFAALIFYITLLKEKN
jgi:PST family polysaccharide transporter